VVSDLTGLTGLRILRAIGRGERDATALAPRRAHRCQASAAPIARALPGTGQPEHRWAWQPSLALYDYYHEQRRACARVSAAQLQGMAVPEVPPLAAQRRGRRRKDNEGTVDARQRLPPVAGGT